MKSLTSVLKPILLGGILLGGIFSASAPMMAHAQTQSQAQSPSTNRTFSLETQKPMQKALGYFDSRNYSKAEKEFKKVLKIKGLSAYERSTVEQYLGQATYQEKDYKDSVKHFENAIAAGGLTAADVTKSEMIIAQLYTRLKDYKKALPPAERWFSKTSAKSRKDYDLMNFLYNAAGQTDRQLAVLQDMTRRWPQDRKLWDHQISALASLDKKFEAYQAYAGLYDRGLLTSREDLSKLLQYHEYYKRYDIAARILDTEIRSGRLDGGETNQAKLAQLRRLARAAPQ